MLFFRKFLRMYLMNDPLGQFSSVTFITVERNKNCRNVLVPRLTKLNFLCSFKLTLRSPSNSHQKAHTKFS